MKNRRCDLFGILLITHGNKVHYIRTFTQLPSLQALDQSTVM